MEQVPLPLSRLATELVGVRREGYIAEGDALVLYLMIADGQFGDVTEKQISMALVLAQSAMFGGNLVDVVAKYSFPLTPPAE